MRRSLILATVLIYIILLSACSALPKMPSSLENSVNENTSLIQTQQSMLTEQSQQLEQVNANQMAIVDALDELKNQLVGLRQQNQPVTKKSEKVVARKVVTKVSSPVEGKMVVGRNEWVWVELFDRYINARIDTGTRSSTLNVKNLQPFERNGESWVRFEVAELEDQEVLWEAPLSRYLRVKNGGGEELERRPVIKVSVRLGSMIEETELTLASKTGSSYPLQLGRDFLRDIAVVDVSRRFIQPKLEEKTVSR